MFGDVRSWQGNLLKSRENGFAVDAGAGDVTTTYGFDF
jgi:hypothetical protein